MKKTNVSVIGEAMIETWGEVEIHPQINSSEKIKNINLFLGGMAVNTAIALSGLGCHCELVTGLGPNVSSDLMEPLKKAGVELGDSFKTINDTSLVYAFYNKEGYRHFHFMNDNGEQIPFTKKFTSETITTPHFVLFSGSHFELFKNIYQQVIKFIPKQNLFFSPSYSIYSYDIKLLKYIIANIHCLFLNDEETEWLCQKLNITMDEVIQQGPNIFIHTKGSGGCTVYTNRIVINVPAIPVNVVNPVGAGDAYNAGFLFGMTNNLTLQQCAQIGNAVASFCVKKPETQVVVNIQNVISLCQSSYANFAYTASF